MSADPAAPGWIRRHRGELLLVAFGCLLALAFGELAVRLVAPQATRVGDDYYLADPEVGWVLMPSHEGVLGNVIEFETRVRTNSLGMRGPEPRGGEPAILGVGDSFMFGYGLEDDETFLAVAAAELGGEALNGGVAGYEVCQSVDLGIRLAERLDPDAIVLSLYVGNDEVDAELGPRRSTAVEGMLVHPGAAAGRVGWRRKITHPIFARSHLVRLIRFHPLVDAVTSKLTGRPTPSQRGHRRLLGAFVVPPLPEVLSGHRQIAECLERLARYGEKRSLPLLAVIIPEMFQVEAGPSLENELVSAGLADRQLDLEAPQRRLGALLAAAEIPFHDLLPDLRRASGAERPGESSGLYFEVDRHLNAEGSRVVGEVIADRLRERLPADGSPTS